MSKLTECDVNRMTLEYFTNPSYYGEIKNSIQPHEANINRIRDIRFYRRRIVALTKELFREDTLNVSLRNAFNEYVNSAIEHLKILDTKDILQDEYSGLEISQISSEEGINSAEHVVEANSKMIMQSKKKIENTTLDSFVLSSCPEEPKEKPPKLKTINLEDPKLKRKGIKQKKRK